MKDTEFRTFKEQWVYQHFVIESSDNAMCIVCKETLVVLKEYNIKYVYEARYSQNYSKCSGRLRLVQYEYSKFVLKSQQLLSKKVNAEQYCRIYCNIIYIQ